MSTGFRKSSRSPRRGSLKMSFRESWSIPSTPSALRISSAPSSRRPFGRASVSPFMRSTSRASGSPRDEQGRRRGGRLDIASRLDDEHAGRTQNAARLDGDPPDQRETVDAAVQRQARLVGLPLRKNTGDEPPP